MQGAHRHIQEERHDARLQALLLRHRAGRHRVKRQRVTKNGGEVVAETTVMLKSYSVSKGKASEGE